MLMWRKLQNTENTYVMKIIIIGAGPGGYETALLAAKRGVEVVLIEAGHVGGTCLNEGCIPTKTFCKHAEVLDGLKEAETFGVTGLSYGFDYSAVTARKNAVVEQLRGGVEGLLGNCGIWGFSDSCMVNRVR